MFGGKVILSRRREGWRERGERRSLLLSGERAVDGLDEDTGDLVGVGVGGRSAILKVALAFLGTLAGNADG